MVPKSALPVAEIAVKARRGVGRLAVRGILRAAASTRSARVVKLVDTGDLKSPDRRGRAGSSPAPGTIIYTTKTCIYDDYLVSSSD